jgi:hypothetical protein
MVRTLITEKQRLTNVGTICFDMRMIRLTHT